MHKVITLREALALILADARLAREMLARDTEVPRAELPHVRVGEDDTASEEAVSARGEK